MEIYKALCLLLISRLSLIDGKLDCFSCININQIEDCHEITLCKTDTERCYTEVSGHPGNLTYELGCREPDNCLHNQANVGSSNVSCHECCNMAGCNKALCSTVITHPVTPCNVTCDDDPGFDCQDIDQVFGVCHDIQHAKNVCRKYCGLCCLVDGDWSAWSTWGDCSVTCGNGSQTRMRTCDNPAPQNGGLYCEGSQDDSMACTKEPCPIHGQWSAWGNWTDCTTTCGVGTTKRHRKCDNPPPARFGNHCFGDGVDFNVCNINNSCSVAGGWSDWSAWDACSQSCGTGMTVRHRNCSNPPPSAGGATCTGDYHGYKLCNVGQPCPPTGMIYTEWTNWFPCTDNVQFRNRTCFLYGNVTTMVDCKDGPSVNYRPCH